MGSIRDRIAATRGGSSERVIVPEWDNIEIEIRSISVKQRAHLLQHVVDGTPNMELFGPSLLVASVFDPETGDRAFTDEDVAMLGEVSAGVVDRLAGIAMRVSGLDVDAVESGKGD